MDQEVIHSFKVNKGFGLVPWKSLLGPQMSSADTMGVRVAGSFEGYPGVHETK